MTNKFSEGEFANETPLQRELRKGKRVVHPNPSWLMGRFTPREINGWLIMGEPGNGMTILRHKETAFTLMMSLN